MFCSCGSTAKKYGRYCENADDQRWQCNECGRIFTQSRKNDGNNFVPGPKRVHLKQLLVAGVPVRAAARAIGVSHITATRYYRLWSIDAKCPCGEPSTHMGFCSWRLQMSPHRSDWLDKQWRKRANTDIARLVQDATKRAEANGHTIATWVWGADNEAGLWPWTKCQVCGCGLSIGCPPFLKQPAEPEGKALTAQCKTPEQREAERQQRADKRAAQQEKNQWLTGKRTLSQVRKLLRDRSSSPIEA